MKKIFLLIPILVVLASCASVPTATNLPSKEHTDGQKSVSTASEYSITSEIFDRLQRPLGFNLSSQLQPIGRQNWEYHMAGIGWWDIYLMSGKKLGNGIFEKPREEKSNCEIIELQNVKSQYDNTVNMVEILFASADKNFLEKLQAEFKTEAIKFTGSAGKISNDSTVSWESGWFSYTLYPIQYHESGKWIFLVSSFDSSNSLY